MDRSIASTQRYRLQDPPAIGPLFDVDLDTPAKHIARLADLEDQAKAEGEWELVKLCQQKRDRILAKLDAYLQTCFGKLLCPLCEPELMNLYPPPNQKLRQCSRHSLPLLVAQGRRIIKQSSTASITSLTPIQMSSWMTNSGGVRSRNLTSSRRGPVAQTPRKQNATRLMSEHGNRPLVKLARILEDTNGVFDDPETEALFKEKWQRAVERFETPPALLTYSADLRLVVKRI